MRLWSSELYNTHWCFCTLYRQILLFLSACSLGRLNVTCWWFSETGKEQLFDHPGNDYPAWKACWHPLLWGFGESWYLKFSMYWALTADSAHTDLDRYCIPCVPWWIYWASLMVLEDKKTFLPLFWLHCRISCTFFLSDTFILSSDTLSSSERLV